MEFMETIFNHNPTTQELSDIRFNSLSLCLKFGIDIKEELTPIIYTKLISQENAYYDLACLYDFRENKKLANHYWKKLPEAYKINGLGFDNLEVST